MKAADEDKSRLTPLTPIASVFTLVSLGWTGYSITDLVHSGWWGVLAAVSVDGLWGIVQYMSYKGIGGKVTGAMEWVTLVVACALLGWHGWTITPAAAFAGALPPIVAKLAWTGDIRLRRDPAAPTAEQIGEINELMRTAAHETAVLHATTKARINHINAQAEVRMAEDEADFQIELKRLDKERELRGRTPMVIDMQQSEQPKAEPDLTVTELRDQFADLLAILGDQARDRAGDLGANPQVITASANREPTPIIADLARDFVAKMTKNGDVVEAIMKVRPDANKLSVAAAVRKARKATESPYL